MVRLHPPRSSHGKRIFFSLAFAGLTFLVSCGGGGSESTPPPKQKTSAPVINSHPKNQTVKEGEKATFNVSATAIPAPTYQWYYQENQAIEGATSSSYTIDRATLGMNNAVYYVVVTNLAGKTTSNTARLSVSPANTPMPKPPEPPPSPAPPVPTPPAPKPELPKVATLGQPCADILGLDGSGQPVTLKQFAGNLIVLDVSATWCGPCNEEAPAFNQMYEKYKGQGVVCVTCIADGAKQGAAAAWKKKHKMTMPVIVDSQGKAGSAEAFYRKSTGYYPTFVIIDRQFKAQYIRSENIKDVESALQKVLNPRENEE